MSILKKVKYNITEQFLIKEYIENGKSQQMIANKIGCSQSCIYLYMKKYNIITRSKANLGKKNGRYIDGKCCKNKKHYCKCGEEISRTSALYGSGLCQSCAQRGKILSEKTKRKLRKYKGKEAGGYKDGRYSKIYYCIEEGCNNEICYDNWKYGQGRCKSCSNKRNAKNNIGRKCSEQSKEKMRQTILKQYAEDPEYKIKISKTLKEKYKIDKNYQERLRKNSIKAFKAKKIKPNKPEKLLNKVLQKILLKEYKYVGEGEIIIDGFCPDFVNVNGQKKIIELYGCYWHKCLECGFGNRKFRPKDVGRIKTYAKFGYNTLIVWEHELKDLEKVKNKILEFNKV